MNKQLIASLILATGLLITPVMAAAQATKKPAAAPVAVEAPAATAQTPSSFALPERIVRPMVALDPVTLKAEGVEIKLWGIRPASTSESPLELKALDLLDGIIEGQQVNCKIEGGQMPVLYARCVVQGSDLSLELLNNGLAIRDRRMTYNTAYASAYGTAEELARHNRKGVWKFLVDTGKDGDGAQSSLTDGGSSMLTWALFGGPLAGMALIGLVLWFWMQNMSKAQQAEAEAIRRKESLLQTREKNVLLTTLEGELLENKNKIEAFMVIYGDMLQGLQSTTETPKYQQVGDIVQKHPSFSKTVFEANVSKLSLLGIKLAGNISKLYASLPKEQEYINLEPGVPLNTAVQLVEKVRSDAQALVPSIDAAIQGLQAAAQQKND